MCIYYLRRFSTGNLVDWDNSNWIIDNMVRETLTVEDVCLLPKPKHVVFPEKRSNADSKRLCNKLKGELTVITSEKMQDELVNSYKTSIPEQYSDYGEKGIYIIKKYYT